MPDTQSILPLNARIFHCFGKRHFIIFMIDAVLQMFKSITVTQTKTSYRLSALLDLYGNIFSSLNSIALLHQLFQKVINAPDVLFHNRIVNIVTQFLFPRSALFPRFVLAVFVAVAFLRVFDDFKPVCKSNFIGDSSAHSHCPLVCVPVLSVHIVRAYRKMVVYMSSVGMSSTKDHMLFPENLLRPLHSDLVSFFRRDLSGHKGLNVMMHTDFLSFTFGGV